MSDEVFRAKMTLERKIVLLVNQTVTSKPKLQSLSKASIDSWTRRNRSIAGAPRPVERLLNISRKYGFSKDFSTPFESPPITDLEIDQALSLVAADLASSTLNDGGAK